jgi:putative flippase GtrA
LKICKLFQEFSRYVLVGGTAFVLDISLLYLFKNYVFYNLEHGVYIAAALGFIGGLIYNYILSLAFVFETAKTRNKGKTVSAFVVFSLVGVAGLLLTELGMYIGIEIFAINYLIVKILVSGIVLIWNYGIRKILIFR